MAHLRLNAGRFVTDAVAGHTLGLLEVAKSAKVDDGTLTEGLLVSSDGDVKCQITVFADGRVHVFWQRPGEK